MVVGGGRELGLAEGVALREILGGDGTGIGGWCVTPSSFMAEVMARIGFDWICIDAQHGLIDYQAMLGMLQGVSGSGVAPLVRVPWNEPAWIMKALDAGAAGVIVPMVNSPEEARLAAGACRYPPQGYRSWGPTRASLGVPDYGPEQANESVICAVMVETVAALDRLEEILAVSGVDAVFMGPSDFAISMGLQPRSDEPEHRRRLEAVPAVCREHGVVAGIACGSIEMLQRWRAAGYTMLSLPSDLVMLRQAATAMLDMARR
jgi:4-hydroxy-2-oxoheptanedioate aldolase